MTSFILLFSNLFEISVPHFLSQSLAAIKFKSFSFALLVNNFNATVATAIISFNLLIFSLLGGLKKQEFSSQLIFCVYSLIKFVMSDRRLITSLVFGIN